MSSIAIGQDILKNILITEWGTNLNPIKTMEDIFTMLLFVFLIGTLVQCYKDGGPHAPGVMWRWMLEDIGVIR